MRVSYENLFHRNQRAYVRDVDGRFTLATIPGHPMGPTIHVSIDDHIVPNNIVINAPRAQHTLCFLSLAKRIRVTTRRSRTTVTGKRKYLPPIKIQTSRKTDEPTCIHSSNACVRVVWTLFAFCLSPPAQRHPMTVSVECTWLCVWPPRTINPNSYPQSSASV